MATEFEHYASSFKTRVLLPYYSCKLGDKIRPTVNVYDRHYFSHKRTVRHARGRLHHMLRFDFAVGRMLATVPRIARLENGTPGRSTT